MAPAQLSATLIILTQDTSFPPQSHLHQNPHLTFISVSGAFPTSLHRFPRSPTPKVNPFIWWPCEDKHDQCLWCWRVFLQYHDPLTVIGEISSVYTGLHVLQWTIGKKMAKRLEKAWLLWEKGMSEKKPLHHVSRMATGMGDTIKQGICL